MSADPTIAPKQIAIPVTAPLPKAPPPSPAPAPPEPSAESLIAELLAHYEAALESRSLSALKRLWPGLSGGQEAAIRDEFQHATRIDVEITSPRTVVTGGTATVTFVRMHQLLTTDGQRPMSRYVATMSLRRTGAGWVIEQLRFDPLR